MVSVRLQYLGVVTVKAVQLKPVPVFIFFLILFWMQQQPQICRHGS